MMGESSLNPHAQTVKWKDQQFNSWLDSEDNDRLGGGVYVGRVSWQLQSHQIWRGPGWVESCKILVYQSF